MGLDVAAAGAPLSWPPTRAADTDADAAGATPAASPVSSNGMAIILTECVASWGVRTGSHLPPETARRLSCPVTGTGGPLALAEQPQVGAGTPLAARA